MNINWIPESIPLFFSFVKDFTQKLPIRVGSFLIKINCVLEISPDCYDVLLAIEHCIVDTYLDRLPGGGQKIRRKIDGVDKPKDG